MQTLFDHCINDHRFFYQSFNFWLRLSRSQVKTWSFIGSFSRARAKTERKPVVTSKQGGKETNAGVWDRKVLVAGKVGGCVSPHPRQRGRWCFDWSHNTRVKTQPVCPVLLCSAPQARNSTAPGKNYPQHFQAYASESRSWPHSFIVYMYKIHCILLSSVGSRHCIEFSIR